MEQLLELLKFDLRILHNLEDTYLNKRIEGAKADIERRGITLDISKTEDIFLIVDYAAWLYKKRDEDVGLPRHLQFRLNNKLISQKGSV
jgi:hypothetical protein